MTRTAFPYGRAVSVGGVFWPKARPDLGDLLLWGNGGCRGWCPERGDKRFDAVVLLGLGVVPGAWGMRGLGGDLLVSVFVGKCGDNLARIFPEARCYRLASCVGKASGVPAKEVEY